MSSYLDTVSLPFELFIVDNGSTDGSRKLITTFASRQPNIHAILLSSNSGGAALNLGLERSSASFLHISENDVEYLPSWDSTAVDLFAHFPSLGQLCPFGPVPTDDEAWEPKEGTLRHSAGRTIYETEGNVSTTSVLRRELWDAGVRVRTAPWCDGDVLFPDDATLSSDIRSHGFTVAWAGRNLVRNLGHTATEFQTRPDYYLAGYRTKFWLGEEGWKERIAAHETRVKPFRTSILYGDEVFAGYEKASTEKFQEASLWSMVDDANPEVETVEFLYAITRLAKPRLVFATFVGNGRAAEAIGRALRANGRGRLLAFELDSDYFNTAKKSVPAELQSIIQITNIPHFDDAADGIDMVLVDVDSCAPAIIDEIGTRLNPAALLIFLGGVTVAQTSDNTFRQLLGPAADRTIQIPTPRGVALRQYVPGSHEPWWQSPHSAD